MSTFWNPWSWSGPGRFVLRRGPEGEVFGAAIGPLQPGIGGDQSPCQPESPRPLQLLNPFLDIVQVDQGHAFEPLRIGMAELRDPVVVSAKTGRQEFAIPHDVVQHEAHRGIHDLGGDAIEVHVFHAFVGQIAPQPDVGKAVGAAECLGLLKAPPCLGAGGGSRHLAAVTIPPVAIFPRDEAGGTVLELGRHAAGPEILGFIHMTVG